MLTETLKNKLPKWPATKRSPFFQGETKGSEWHGHPIRKDTCEISKETSDSVTPTSSKLGLKIWMREAYSLSRFPLVCGLAVSRLRIGKCIALLLVIAVAFNARIFAQSNGDTLRWNFSSATSWTSAASGKWYNINTLSQNDLYNHSATAPDRQINNQRI